MMTDFQNEAFSLDLGHVTMETHYPTCLVFIVRPKLNVVFEEFLRSQWHVEQVRLEDFSRLLLDFS